MAGEQQPTVRVPLTEISTHSGTTSANVGRGTETGYNPEGGSQSSIELDPRTGKVAGQPPVEGDGQDTPTPATEGEGDTPPTPVEEGDATEALPDFNPANEEVRSKYDARYFNEEGKLNLQALTKEFWANASKADKPVQALNEGTYKYLEETLGITKEAAQAIEKGLVAEQRAANGAFYSKVGGRERWNAALEWGKGSYTPEQRTRFNAALNGNDPTARDDAVEALMARYDRVNPKQGGRRGPPRRNASPERSSTAQAAPGAGASGGNVPFPTRESYQEAWGKALAAEKNAKSPADKREATAAREKVQKDGRASQRNWK